MTVDLLREIVNKGEKNAPVVLVTIIEASGSTPREAGTQMLVYPNGEIKGTIGGGLGEEKAKKAALKMFEDNKSLQKLEMSLHSDLQAKEGMVCGGNQTILLEKIPG